MNEQKKKRIHIKPNVIFSVIVLVCCLLFGITLFRPQVIKPVQDGVARVLLPLQRGMNQMGSILFENEQERRTNAELQKENAKLQAQIDALTEENIKLSLDNYELARLRELLSLSDSYLQHQSTGARVIAKDSGSLFSQFTIDKGSADGIETNMNVLVGAGLMGIVTDTNEHFSNVRTIIDDSSNVSAMVIRTSALCMVEGSVTDYENGYLTITGFDKNADIQIGDAIVTSNVSSLYLPGILVGYVTEISEDPNNMTKSGRISLASRFENINEVLVIQETKNTGEE